MALFIDYLNHRKNSDTVVNEAKEALGIADDRKARLQFAGRVAHPTFATLRDMATYCGEQMAPDLWRAFVLAENF